MEEKTPSCMNCSKPLKSGRIDKKFCDEGCRNQYHNELKIAEHAEIKKINGILKTNRKILKSILKEERSEIVAYETLLKKGFEFDYHTHYITSQYQKNVYTFCYNYGYRKLENDKYKIVKGFK